MARRPAVGSPLGAQARARVAATAPPVVLVSGWGNQPAIWSCVARGLRRDGFDVHAFDPPGRNVVPIGDVVTALGAFVRRLDLDRVDLVGHSRGGIVCRAWAQLEDEGRARVRRVVTIASANRGFDLGPLHGLIGARAPVALAEQHHSGELVTALATATPTPRDGRIQAVGTRGFDGAVIPPSLMRIDGAPFRCVDEGRRVGPFPRVGHYRILHDDVAYEAIRDALLDVAPETA
ncbi:MAG: lipase [Thermoleophilia bacterium]|nr:lipase [Thermoleophilia bacterium]